MICHAAEGATAPETLRPKDRGSFYTLENGAMMRLPTEQRPENRVQISQVTGTAGADFLVKRSAIPHVCNPEAAYDRLRFEIHPA